MIRPIALVALTLCCTTACLRSGPRNSNCQWPPDSAASLNLRDPQQQRHLSDDAELAEDLAIRYADVHRGPHSGHFEGMPEYSRTRDTCMAQLFHTAATTHQVSDAQVRQSLGIRRTGFDAAISLAFALLYTWLAWLLAGRLNRLYPDSDSALSHAAIIVYVSAIVSLAGVLLGELWAGLAENIRVGSGHLSYRGARVPWSHYNTALFIAGLVIFWSVAALRHRPLPTRARYLNLDSAA